MIARVWRASAASEKVADYVRHFQHSVLPELTQIPGYRGFHIMRRDMGDAIEITVMTLWESMDAIRRFAGADVEQAVVEPAAQAVLRSFDTRVSHHEIILSGEHSGS
jgi:heme-degrading monooxygenase HmoA